MEALEITWGVPPEMYYDRRVVDTQATKSEKHLRSGLIFKYLRRYSEELSETVYSELSDNLTSSTSLTVEIESTLSWIEIKKISIPNPAAIREYLLSHFDLTALVQLVCDITSERSGPDSKLSLEVYKDPELDDSYLTLYVRKENYNQSFDRDLDEISAEFESKVSETSGWLTVTTDFESPK